MQLPLFDLQNSALAYIDTSDLAMIRINKSRRFEFSVFGGGHYRYPVTISEMQLLLQQEGFVLTSKGVLANTNIPYIYDPLRRTLTYERVGVDTIVCPISRDNAKKYEF